MRVFPEVKLYDVRHTSGVNFSGKKNCDNVKDQCSVNFKPHAVKLGKFIKQ